MSFTNEYSLPSNQGSSRVEDAERMAAGIYSIRNYLLEEANRFNTGTDTVILTSGAAADGTYCEDTSAIMISPAILLSASLRDRGFSGIGIMHDATKIDLQKTIQDPKVAHIFLLGHSTFESWLSTDGKSVHWSEAAEMAEGHLKQGVFANLGCGEIRSWSHIPLGKFVISSSGLLIGKKKETAKAKEMHDLARYQILN